MYDIKKIDKEAWEEVRKEREYVTNFMMNKNQQRQHRYGYNTAKPQSINKTLKQEKQAKKYADKITNLRMKDVLPEHKEYFRQVRRHIKQNIKRYDYYKEKDLLYAEMNIKEALLEIRNMKLNMDYIQ